MRTIGMLSLSVVLVAMTVACGGAKTAAPAPSASQPVAPAPQASSAPAMAATSAPAAGASSAPTVTTAPAGAMPTSAPAAAEAPTAASTAAPTSQVELSLAGTVFDAQGQPVGQATVELYEGRYDPVAWMRFRLAGSAITDMMGKYAIISRVGTLPLAQCVVIARKDGLAMDWNGAALDAPRQIEMPFQLGPQGRLAGVVVDEKDQPLAGVTLRPLIQARFGPAAKQLVGLPALDFLAQRTDAEGHFEFTGLPATASAEFLLEGPGRARMTTLPSSPEDQHQAYKAGTSDVRIVSLPAASVSGRIVDEQGQGIGGLTLAGAPASMAGPLEMVWTLTGADGRYRLEGLRPVAYSIGLTGPATGMGEWAVKTGDLKPETGQAVENFDFTATKGGVLEVVIRRGETPAPKVYFRLAGVGVVAPLLAMTDEEGRYLLRAAPGMWKVLGVLLPDYVPIEQPPAVSVEANSTIQSVVILERRPQIAGTVLDDHGKPVGGAVVQLLHLPAQVGTDPNGHFEFDFVASRLDEQYKDQRAVYVRADDLVAARILKDSDRAPLELKLSPGLMAQGRVMDPNGAPVHGAPIDVMAFGQQWNHPMGTLATTDAQGRYSIAHLAAGLRYRLAPIAPGFGQMPAGITTSSEQTGTVDVAPIVLPPANLTISGTVVDVDGAGVPKADVAVYGQYIVPERKSQADEQGHFTVDGLTAGPLIVSASAQINGQTWHGRSEAAGGQKDVEVTLQNPSGLNRPKPNPQIGKPLGDLSVFSPLPAPGAMEGKRVLVCFWSLLHSGAVDALRDLSKRSEELRTQGIVIVTVLTSDERRMVVDRWLSQNGISLPLGRLPADPRQSRALLRQWNVGDMPWLLLTDENHIVRAESNDLDTLLGTPKKPASMPAGFGSGPEFPGRPQTAPTSMPNR